ncbi:MAG: hypothetical protein ACYC9D_01490 [Candidatus Dormibacteria bacterium]
MKSATEVLPPAPGRIAINGVSRIVVTRGLARLVMNRMMSRRDALVLIIVDLRPPPSAIHKRASSRAIREFGDIMNRTTRHDDLVFRMADRRYALVLRAARLADAAILLERAGNSVIERSTGPINVCAGVAEWDGREQVQGLVTRASSALDRAREAAVEAASAGIHWRAA